MYGNVFPNILKGLPRFGNYYMALKLSCVTKVYGNVFPNILKGLPRFGNYYMALKLSCVTKVYGNVFPNILKGAVSSIFSVTIVVKEMAVPAHSLKWSNNEHLYTKNNPPSYGSFDLIKNVKWFFFGYFDGGFSSSAAQRSEQGRMSDRVLLGKTPRSRWAKLHAPRGGACNFWILEKWLSNDKKNE